MPKTFNYRQRDNLPYQASDATGKNLPSLERSRAKRLEILKMFNGELPESIMRANRASRGMHDPDAVRSYDASAHYPAHTVKGFRTSGKGVNRGSGHARGEADSEARKKAFHNSGQGARGGALSAFPQNIGRAVVLLYSEPGNVIVDPFAGHNSRMQLCVEAGRHYIGYDISQDFTATNEKLRSRLMINHPNVKIILHCHDSRHLKFTPNEIAHFTLTSPPYYDLEWYGDEPEQLGKSESYETFLHELGKIAKENYRVLKHGAYCVWFVNDFRAKGRFFLYHIDVLNLLTAAGFVPHDIMIVDFGAPLGSIFLQTTVERRYLPKRHEYGLVVRKL